MSTKRPLSKHSLKKYSWKDDMEEMFVDYHKRRRIYIHPVPAPWSRVVLVSLVYGLLISMAKFAWFQTFGEPHWVLLPQVVVESSEQEAISKVEVVREQGILSGSSTK